MKTNFDNYNYENSRDRIDNILNASNDSFEELDHIPPEDKLTFSNGFYVDCSALFVDIRKSSELPNIHTRPVLAKIYRAYISELVAIMNEDPNCKKINIYGDSVWGVFNTEWKKDIDEVFGLACRIASLIDTLNIKLRKKGFQEIAVGIGIDYGRALMIKSGYSGSGINEVVWMGDVVNTASKLCDYGNSSQNDREIMVSNAVYSNLNEYNKSLLVFNPIRNCYHGNIVNIGMDEWVRVNQSII